MPIKSIKIRFILLFVLLLAIRCENLYYSHIPQDLNRIAVENIVTKQTTFPFRFVIIGDVQSPGEKVFSKLRLQINSLVPAPSFIIVVGDLVRRGVWSEYQAYVDSISKSIYPVISVIGNHGHYGDNGLVNYRILFGKTDFYFDYYILRFICMDNAVPGKYGLTGSQISWLTNLLINSKSYMVFIFMHVPMNYQLEYISKEYKDRIGFFCFGHEHLFRRYSINGIPCIVSGGGGGELVKLSEVEEGQKLNVGIFHHFVVIDIYDLNIIKGQVIRLNNGTNSDSTYNFTSPVQ